VHAQAVEDSEWLERSRAILEESVESAPPEWLRAESTDAALDAAREIAERSRGRDVRTGESTAPGRILIFASFSIPEVTLKGLLLQATERNVVLVLRGVPKGSTVPGTVARLKRLLAGDAIPHVMLDPTLFRRFAVERVPTFALERGPGQKPVIARGAVTSEWVRRMAARVQTGDEDLGRRAEDYAIAETDLIEEMQQRLALVDFEARRREAIEQFWSKHGDHFVDLPDAKERRELLIDPSVRVTEDVDDADGTVLVSAGQTFNPLAWVPLSKTIVVFRGTDPRQVSKAQELARDARVGGRGVILLTTAIQTDRGWQHLSELERTLSGAVYVLPPSLVERFHLARVPATIVSRGQRLLVTEVPVGGPQ
jgi:conjugal transfer pilus assembly protein TraW